MSEGNQIVPERRTMLPCVSGSQMLLHIRITWGALKNPDAQVEPPQLNQCAGWKPGIRSFRDRRGESLVWEPLP